MHTVTTLVGLITSLLLLFSPSGADTLPLPQPISNNAVAALEKDGSTLVLSALGIGPGLTYRDITNAAYLLDLRAGKWTEIPPVPDPGRIAATAVAVNGRFYVFGGYMVAPDGKETSVPDVNIYDPAKRRWSRGAEIPVPVDDSAAAVYHNRYVYLISGWSQTDNVRNVQVYDTVEDSWKQASPIAGTPVFGQAGGIAGDTLIYVDGAYRNPAASGPKYIASEECWRGEIDRRNLTHIRWKRIPKHPGSGHYRIAAGSSGDRVYFDGGTNNPYNYNGIGYDGNPSKPSPVVFAWNEKERQWMRFDDDPQPSMDHRGLVVEEGELIIVGGMYTGQKVSNNVKRIRISAVQP